MTAAITYRPAAVAAARGKVSGLYDLVSLFFLLQATEAFGVADRLIYGAWDGKGGDKLTQGLNLLQMVASLALFERGFRLTRTIGLGGKLAIGLALFLLASAAWSVDPDTSIRRGVLYLFFVLGAIGLAGLYDARRFMQLFGLTCAISAFGSILLLVVSPKDAFLTSSYSDGFVPGSSDYRGIFSHKNVLGQVMAAGALACLHGARSGGGRRWRNLGLVALFLAMTVACKSATSMVTILFFIGISGASMLLHRGGAVRIFGIVACIVLGIGGVIAACFPDTLLEMLGKDATLTGRTELWAYVTTEIAQRPILGWGFFAFWTDGNEASTAISVALGWNVPEAHNGLLEMLLEIGVVGTAIMVFYLGRTLVLAIRCLKTDASELGVSALLSCIGIILVGMTEMVMLDSNQAAMGIFFVTGFMCERALRTQTSRIPARLGSVTTARFGAATTIRAAPSNLQSVRTGHGGR